MDFIEIFYFITLGAITGFLSGLLGVGGGVVIVPALYYIFQFLGFDQTRLMHLSIGTSLATMIITSTASAISHQKRKAIFWKLSKFLVPGVIIGSSLGVILAHFISSQVLADIFGIFSLLLAAYFLLPKMPSLQFKHPSKYWLIALGSIVGLFSALLGIGGGVIAVPMLIAFNLPTKNAVATSSSLTFFTALIGSIGYLIVGFKTPIPDSFGYIFLPAFFAMGASAVLLAPYGVRLAHFLPTLILKRIFALCLGITGVSMIRDLF